MDNTTAANPYINATFTYPLDYYYAMFVNPVTVVRIYQIAYPITFFLGFIGNTASLITFSRSTLRKVSTGCLFIILAISDTLYLLMCIFDFVEFGLKVMIFQYHSVPESQFFFFPHRFSYTIMLIIMGFVDFDHLFYMYLKYYLHGH